MKLNVLFLSLLICLSAQGGEEPMVLKTATGDIYGTLLMPDNQQKVPIVLFISGSGPTDRDGNQPNMTNNSLKMVAESLAQNGIASLRFDKRGVAASAAAMDKEEDLRFESYINDVKAWITLLATDSRFSKVHVAGHSEGALIGTVASGGNFLVSSLVLIAGTGQPADVVLKEQLKNTPPQLKDMVYPMIDKLKKGDTINNVPPSVYMLFRPSVQPYLISWFAYDPAAELKKVSVPVLILAGDKDIQVTKENADFLHAAKPGAVKVVIPDMNHVLKECATTDQMQQVAVYTNSTLPVRPQLLDELIGFLKKN